MTPSDLESRILHLATARGLLRLDQVPEEGKVSGSSSRWGPRLSHVQDQGWLSEAVVEALAWEAMNERIASPGDTGTRWTLAVAPQEAEGPFVPPARALAPRYSELRPVGQGGMGMVFEAQDQVLNRRVALKFLKGKAELRRDQILTEARAQAQMDHPNVCKVFDVGEADGMPFLSMQLVQGITLRDASLELREAVVLMRDVAEGVHAAHRAGLLHLDLEPSNVLLESREPRGWHPYVSDFGAGRSEVLSPGGASGAPLMGTPPYTSPEQLRGSQLLDRRSDVYSLGVMLHQVAAGVPPFEAPDREGLMAAILHGRPRLSSKLPADLRHIIARALELKAENRYATALAFADDLQRFLDGQPIAARPRTPAYRAERWMSRHRALSWSLAGGLILALAAALLGIRASIRARRKGEIAQHFEQLLDRAEAVIAQDRMLPLHDHRKARAYYWEQIAAMRTEMAQEGSLAEAAGEYALGRAEIDYGDRRKALEHLEKAWSEGLRTPMIQAALGEARTNLYLGSRGQAMRLQNPKARQTALDKLERELRDAGWAMTRQVAPVISGPRKISMEGRFALSEERWQDALKASAQLKQDYPWMYEGWMMEGQALFHQAQLASKEGREKDAVQALDLAVHSYEETIRRFPSASGARRHISGVIFTRARARWHLDRADPGPAFQEAFRWLDTCLEVDPAYDLYDGTRIDFWCDEMVYLMEAHRDPTPICDKVVALAEARIRKGPPEAYGFFTYEMLALSQEAEWHRRDPAREIEDVLRMQQAVAAIIAQGPEAVAPHGQMVEVLRRRGELELALGQDARETLSSARSSYRAALAQDPSSPAAADMALLLGAIAESSRDRRLLTEAEACLGPLPNQAARPRLARARILRVEAALDPAGEAALLEKAASQLQGLKATELDQWTLEDEARRLKQH